MASRTSGRHFAPRPRRGRRREKKKCSPFWNGTRSGVGVVGSASLVQGELTRGLPSAVRKQLGASDAETAIQSAPGLVTALIGMGRAQHVSENLAIAHQPPVPLAQWTQLFNK